MGDVHGLVMNPDDVNLRRLSAVSVPRRAVLLALMSTLGGCSESTPSPRDAAAQDSAMAQDSAPPDAASDSSVDALASDAAPILDASTSDAPEDATYVRYERDVRPMLEASACGDCHVAIGMDYAWISAPGETWCSGSRYDRRWHCFEEHARTQVAGTDGSCDTDFYHRHGEPCFEEETQQRVLSWAADGYRE